MKAIIKRILFIVLAIYVIYTFISQQKLLNTYAKEGQEYSKQIEQANEVQSELNEKLQSLNSTEQIEEIARDKLDMYLPNERVYIDMSK